MSKWTNPKEWVRLLTPEGCPICIQGRPTSVIGKLEVSWVTMGEEAPALPGTCALFFRRHAVELHELSPAEAAAYMRDIQRLSQVLKAATGAIKLNYEVHGNTIPHLHMHFFPRYPGDPFEGGPIDPHPVREKTPQASEHEQIRQRVTAALARGGVPAVLLQ